MSTSRRPSLRRARGKRNRFSTSPQAAVRRLWGAERLEDRTMLAGDFVRGVDSEYWNYAKPNDVNADGNVSAMDLLSIVNVIIASGAGKLPTSEAGGEGQASSTASRPYVDTNNDGSVNALDMLRVINDMIGGEGEDPPMATFTLIPVIQGTNTPLPAGQIKEGDFFEVRVMVQDNGVLEYNGLTRTPLQPRPISEGGGFYPNSNLGVFSAYLDMLWDKNQLVAQTNHAKNIQIQGSPQSGTTTFRLTFNGNQTADISYVGHNATTANNIRNALANLPGGRTTISNLPNFEVEPETANNTFRVRFLNDLSNRDGSTLTLTGATVVAGGATGINITSVLDGSPTNAPTFTNAFTARNVRSNVAPFDPINTPLLYTFTPNASNVTAGANDAGATYNPFLLTGQPPLPLPGAITDDPGNVFEVFRVRMNAIESNQVAAQEVAGDVTTIDPSFRMTLFGFLGGSNPTISADRISIVDASFQITEEVTAPFYSRTMIEDAGTVSINPLTNTVSNDGIAAKDNNIQVGDVFNLRSFTQPTGGAGSVDLISGNLVFTPTSNFNGTTTFTYTVADRTTGGNADTGTITITITPDNDAPVNTVPASSAGSRISIKEDPVLPADFFTFAGANTVSVTDVEALAGGVNVQVTLTVSNDGTPHGTLALGSIAGLSSVSNNGTGTVILSGTVAAVNNALVNTVFTPRANFTGDASITVLTSDLGTAPGPTAKTDSDTIFLNVTAVNDAPVISYQGTGVQQTTPDNVPLFFNNANSNKISVSDVDAGSANVQVTVSTSQGGKLLAASGSTATINPALPTDATSITITGPLVEVNKALDGLRYVSVIPVNDSITVTMSDLGNTGSPGAQAATPLNFSIIVTASSRPFAIPDNYTFDEGPASYLLDVLNGPLPDFTHTGETSFLVAGSVTAPMDSSNVVQGTAVIEGTQIRYTPPSANYSGTVTFFYTMNETDNLPGASDGPSTAKVTVTINNVNDAPSGADKTVVTLEDNDYVFTAADFGFTDPNDNPANTLLAVKITTLPSAGALLLNGVAVTAGQFVSEANITGGLLRFDPPQDANGTGFTSFTFQVQDNGGTTNSGVDLDPSANTITIDVTADNDAPVAVNDGSLASPLTTLEDITLDNINVLGNDTDVDLPGGLSLQVTTFTQPTGGLGTVTLNGDGTFKFVPTPDLNGPTSFTYKIKDDQNLESVNSATVFINVTPDDDKPVAIGDSTSYTVEEQTTLTVGASTGLLRASSPLVTDVDTARSNLRVALVSGPSVGNLTLNSDGSFNYTPPTVSPPSTATFVYKAFDINHPTNFSNDATITINITPFNDAPTASATASVNVTEDTPRNITVAELVTAAGAADEENSPLSIVLVSGVPAGFGTLTQLGDGSFNYSPPAQKFDSTSFTTFSIRFSDGSKTSTPPTVVSINLLEDNDAPVAIDDSYTAIRNFTNQTIDVLSGVNSAGSAPDNNGNDTTANGPASDLVGETLRVTAISDTVGGSLVTVTADGSGNSADLVTDLGSRIRLVGGQVRFDSPPNLDGVSETFDYTLSDGRGKTDTGTVSVNVVNFIPKSISGRVFIDKNNDGFFNGTDQPLMNVEIRLDGQDLLNPGSPIDVHMVDFTDANGFYSFDNLRPGSYRILQLQPLYMGDGMDRESSDLAEIDGNNAFLVEWTATDFSGDVAGLNMTETGINPTANNPGESPLIDSSGFYGEILASSGSQGVLFGVDESDATDWAYTLPGVGWANLRSVRLQLVRPGLASGLLTVTDLQGNTYTKTIFQDPKNNVGGTTPPAGSLARFRVLGIGANGEAVIRLDGSAADFGFTLLAAAPVMAGGEGEGPATADREFSQGADAVYAAGQWA